MALRHKSAIKRARQSENRRLRNRAAISTLKTLVKKVVVSAEGKAQDVQESLRLATAYIDKAAGKGLIHKNKASRIVSRLTARVSKSANR